MSFPRAIERVLPSDGRTIRVVVPLTRETLFTLEDISLIRSLELDEMWVMEYALFIWLGITTNKLDDLYDIVCDDVVETICPTETPNQIRLRDIFSEHAESFVDILKRVCEKYRIYLQDLPLQAPIEDFDSLTLERESLEDGFTVVNLNLHK